MKRTGDFFEGMATVEQAPQIELFTVEQQVAVALEVVQHVDAAAAGALGLRGDRPEFVGDTPWPVAEMGLAAVDLVELKARFAGFAREQLEFRRFGHDPAYVDLRPNRD